MQRKLIASLLREVAADYFNDVPMDTENGICSALNFKVEARDLKYDVDAYFDMDSIMFELDYRSSYFGPCSTDRSKWENRAYMCLFLAEYLEGKR